MARARKVSTREALSPERIEDAALALIEEVGLEDFSTRKLAARLGCEAMSIYHYFPSRAHLVEALFDRVVGSIPAPDPGLPWRRKVEHWMYAYRAMAHRHPRFFPFVALHRHNTRAGLALLRAIIDSVLESGAGIEAVARHFRALSYYVVGAALDETSGYAKGPGALEPVPGEEVAQDFPSVVAVNPYFQPEAQEATFRLGLDALVDQLARAAESVRPGTGQG